MPAITATYAVELKDETSGSAKSAAESLERLKTKIDEDTKALREMQAAMKRLQGGTSVNVKTFAELRDRIASQKASIASSQDQFIKLGGAFGKTAAKATEATASFDSLATEAATAGGPIASMAGVLGRMGALLANPITLVLALAAGMLVLAAAIGAATLAMLRFGIIQSDARRNEALQIEGLNTLRRHHTMFQASVRDTQAAIDRAEDSTNLGRDALQGYARQLARTGLQGNALSEAVEAMGIAAMVQGEAGANRFRALAMQARLAGGSVSDLAEQYRNRLGPIARRQMLGLDNQTLRLQRNLSRMFSGLNIEPFLGALDRVLSLFSQSTVTGRQLKLLIERLFGPILEQTSVLGPIVRSFFQGIIIAVLILEREILKLRIAWRRAFGRSDVLDNIDAVRLSMYAGIAVVSLLIGAVFSLALAFGVMAAATLLALAPFILLAALFVGIPILIGYAVSALMDFFNETNFSELAGNMIDGLVEGLRSGLARVATAAGDVATAASDAFRSALGISSPSQVFSEFGANISAGVAQGVDSGSGEVNGAIGGLVDVPEGSGTIGGPVTVSIGDVMINAAETNNPRELAQAFRDQLASILEGVLVESGAAQ